MATVEWIGNALAAQQVTEWVFGGTWEATDIVNVTINTKVVSVAAGSTTIATVLDNVLAAIQAAQTAGNIPELNEITFTENGSTKLIGTGNTAGVPFTVTVSTTETGGGAADDQTIDGAATSTGTTTTAPAGPNDASQAKNYSGGAVPSNGDTLIIARPVSILYGLTALASTTFAAVKIHSSFWSNGAKIGLPETNGTGASAYREYRDRYLQFSTTTLCEVGVGENSGGSSIINLDFQTTNVAITVHRTPTSTDRTRPALLIKMNPAAAADGTLEVLSGSVGVGFNGESNKCTPKIGFQTNQETDSVVKFGAAVTFGATFEQSGGDVTIETATTEITKTGGTLTINGTGAHPILDNWAGTVVYNSTGALGATRINVGQTGVLNLDQDMSAKTVSSTVLLARGGSLISSRFNTAFQAVKCRLEDVNVVSPFDKTWTPS